MIEFVAQPASGRKFTGLFKVRLGDADREGVLRLDGLARMLQDVATDDWDDSSIGSSETWVVRRTAVRIAEGGRWPRYREDLRVTTWCGGVGAAWAERRTDIAVGARRLVEAAALWVPIDATGHPLRIKPEFLAVYGEAIAGRRVSGRIEAAVVAEGATSRPWPLRRADLDIVGHVNNAAVWQVVDEVVDGPVREVVVTHHGPVEYGHEVTLAAAAGSLWLLVDGVVRVSARFRV